MAKKPPPAAPAFEIRIVGYGVKPAEFFTPNPQNPRLHPPQQKQAVKGALSSIGWISPVIYNRRTKRLIDGHERVEQSLQTGSPVPYVEVDLSADEERLSLATFDWLTYLAGYDPAILESLTQNMQIADAGLSGALESLLDYASSEAGKLDSLVNPPNNDTAQATRDKVRQGLLVDKFIVPPFSVLDARQGYWQERKTRWLSLGIQSEVGRGDNLLLRPHLNNIDVFRRPEASKRKTNKAKAFGGAHNRETGYAYPVEMLNRANGTSVFDPVLCEIAYRWFCPPAGTVLDPFAGGSVRGIVAATLGRQYTGIELRPEQVEANRVQAATILGSEAVAVEDVYDCNALTPVQQFGNQWAKRDDAFICNGVRGGKVRTCLTLSQNGKGLVTAGSRQSPQANIVAHIAQFLGIPCRVHTPEGELSAELAAARQAGAEVIQHKAGHNSVIIARARADSRATGFVNIPFGMECHATIQNTRVQAANIPADVARVVIPVGLGMSLAGLLHGLADSGRHIPVLGVVVGADPTNQLTRYAPANWQSSVTLVRAQADYHTPADHNRWNGITLDPYYEAKCLPFLTEGDLLWIVGLRQTAHSVTGLQAVEPVETPPAAPPPRWVLGSSLQATELLENTAVFDMVFSCPPYYDLEIYSDDPADLSAASDYTTFLRDYREIIRQAVDRLAENRFAVWVVGDIRDKKGNYRNFVGDTIAAFIDAGAVLYNEAILVTAVGSLPIRIGGQFAKSRKLGKTHQNVLVFVKGDGRRAAEVCGAIDVSLPELQESGGLYGEQ